MKKYYGIIAYDFVNKVPIRKCFTFKINANRFYKKLKKNKNISGDIEFYRMNQHAEIKHHKLVWIKGEQNE